MIHPEEKKEEQAFKEIVLEYLTHYGYDGLFCDECSCKIDDLMPCDNPIMDCEAGHKVLCPGADICNGFPDCDFHIGEK